MVDLGVSVSGSRTAGAAPIPADARKVAKLRSGREPRMVGLAYAGPALGLYSLFVFLPFCLALYLSFFNWSGVGPLTFAGFSNYTALWDEPDITWSFVHVAVLIAFFAALPVAIALFLTAVMTHAAIRGLTVYRTLLFLPQIIALVAIAVVWEWILASDGPIDSALRGVGLSAVAVDWLGSFHWALPAVGVVGSWIGYGFAMVIFMAGVERIPPSLYDAARVDGAGPVREFFAVTLPGLRNELVVVFVLTITAAMTTFDVIYIMTSGGPGFSTTVPAYSLYEFAFVDFKVGTAAAVGVILALMVFLVALVILRFHRQSGEA